MIGKKFDSRFQVLEKLQHNGGMGEIYFVEDLTKKFDYKIIMKLSKIDDDERFRKEIKIMRKLSESPKIANILYFSLEGGTPYYIMKFYENGSLNSFYKDKLKNSFTLQQKIFLEMIEGIEEIHSQNKYHRDIKPDNFLIDDDKNIIVSDFGLSVDLSSTSKRITNTGDYGGTDGYMPPEFSEDPNAFKYPKAQSDIYMLGKSFYVLLTNLSPSYINRTKIPNFLYYIIDKACDRNMEKRYKNLDDLKSDLENKYKLNELDSYEKIKKLCKNEFLNNLEVIEIYKLFLTLERVEQKDILKFVPTSFLNSSVNIKAIEFKYILEVYAEIVEEYLENDSKFSEEFMDRFRESMRIIVRENIDSASDEIIEALYLLVVISEHRGEWNCQGILQSITNEEIGQKLMDLLLSKNQMNNLCISSTDIEECQSYNIKKLIRISQENNI